MPGSILSQLNTPGCDHRPSVSTRRGDPAAMASSMPVRAAGRSVSQMRWWRLALSSTAQPNASSSFFSRDPPRSFSAIDDQARRRPEAPAAPGPWRSAAPRAPGRGEHR